MKHDKIFSICSQLVRIDNRPVAELAKAAKVCPATVYRLKAGKGRYMHTPTAVGIASAAHYVISIKRRT